MKNFCYQGSEHDCGFASLKMLLAIISKNKNYLYLPKEKDQETYSLLDLIEIAATHQVNLGGYEMEFSKISEQQLPIIMEINGKHLVVLTKVKKDVYYISDPSEGKMTIKGEELAKLYSGHVLKVENESINRDYKAEKPRLMPKSYPIIHAAVGALVVLMLGLDFYLMNLSENIPLIFMLIMFLILVEVFENWYLVKMSDYFDSTYIPLYFRKQCHQNSEEYQRYLGVKVGLLNSSKSIVVYASLAIVLGVLISINDPKNLLVIAIIMLYKAVEKYLTQFKDEKVVKELSQVEEGAFDHQGQTVSTLLDLNKKANQHALSLTTRNCFFQLVLMLITLFMMILSKTMSVNFAVFHFGIYFIIGQGVALVFGRITEHQNRVKDIAQFCDRCGL